MNRAMACATVLLVAVSACSNQARSVGDGLTVEADQVPADICMEKYRDKIENCHADRDNGEELCENMYGDDPEGWTGCMKTANDDNSNCVRAAANKYSLCVDYRRHLARPDRE